MKTSMLVASALATAVSIAAIGAVKAGPAAVPGFDHEKCFGIARSGSNDCQTAKSSCAGTSKKDMQADAWVYLPAGTCDKIAGGRLMPKA